MNRGLFYLGKSKKHKSTTSLIAKLIIAVLFLNLVLPAVSHASVEIGSNRIDIDNNPAIDSYLWGSPLVIGDNLLVSWQDYSAGTWHDSLIRRDGSIGSLPNISISPRTNNNSDTIMFENLADGNILVYWYSGSSGTGLTDTYFKIVDPNWNEIVGATKINSQPGSLNRFTVVDQLSNGNLAFVWATDGSNYAMRRFTTSGVAIDSSQLSVTSLAGISGSQYSHSIKADNNGRFMIMISYYNPNYVGMVFENDSSTPIKVNGSNSFVISSRGENGNEVQHLDVLSNGKFLTVYQKKSGSATNTRSVAFRIYNSDGTPYGDEQIIRQTHSWGSINPPIVTDTGFILPYTYNDYVAPVSYIEEYDNEGHFVRDLSSVLPSINAEYGTITPFKDVNGAISLLINDTRALDGSGDYDLWILRGGETKNSEINPTSASFDKNSTQQADVTVNMTLNGNTLQSITNNGNALVQNTDYFISGDTVTIKKEYLAKQTVGSTSLLFTFSAGSTQTLQIAVSDTTPETYRVIYHGNNQTEGNVPVDSNEYESGQSVTVLNNTGGLKKTGYNFAGWNTAMDGSGRTYQVNDRLTMAESNVDLFAKWVKKSNNADLSQLTISMGELQPAFSAGHKDYEVKVPAAVDSIRLTPTVASTTSTVTVQGNPVEGISEPITLGFGENLISIVVTAEDGTTNTYTVSVERNNPPSTADSIFTIDENTVSGTSVGFVNSSEQDGDPLTYTILSGNSGGAFEINHSTGELKVANGSLLDYEVTTSYTLAIQVSDGTDTSIANVTINLNDLNDNIPVSYGFSTNIEENSVNGTVVGTVSATDADANTNFTYHILSGNESGAFAINETSGVVSVQDGTKLDYETTKSFELTVQVSDGDHTVNTTVTVYLINLNDNQPTVENAFFTINENSPVGAHVGRVIGSDADGDLLSYSIIAGNDAGVFMINAITGDILVSDSSQLDYETNPFFELKVRVSDGSLAKLRSIYSLFYTFASMDSDVSTIRIDLNDLNDNNPVPQGFTTSIDENSGNGSYVGTVTATDADAGSHFTYQITTGNEASVFVIDEETGVVTVADETKLDYETTKSFELTVQVSDGFYTADTTVTVHLNNLNDNQPTVENAVFTINENSPIGAHVGRVIANDVDGDALSYSIIAGNDAGAFTINALTGDILVADSIQLDYETTPFYELKVQVSDGTLAKLRYSIYSLFYTLTSVDSDIATIRIDLNDLNDNSPVPQGFTASIDENSGNGSYVGTVTATDADTGSHFTYQITSGNDASAFVIDEETGVVTVADETKLDYETTKSFELTVQVSDGIHTADTTVTVHLNNLNDNTPVGADETFTIKENAANGTVIGSIQGTDEDADTLRYAIIDGNEAGAFEIDETSGELTVADSTKLDYEQIQSFTLTTQVSDGKHNTENTVTIHLTNLNDNRPIAEEMEFSVEENAANATAVGTVVASDADGDILNYSILSGNEAGAFGIDAATGELTVADSTKLDFEEIQNFTLTTEVSDGKHKTESSVTIHLTNLNDNHPVAEEMEFTIEENAANATVVGTVVASDADGDTLQYSILSGNEAGAFEINAPTGELTVADSTKLDFEKNQSFTLTTQVSDGKHNTENTVTIHLTNLNDNHPVVEEMEFSVEENAANATVVGTVVASDADGDSLTYSILDGNETGAFKIDATSGELTVADSTKLDYEEIQSFTLTTEVSDGKHNTENTVTIRLTNLNDNHPVAEEMEFSVEENTANGTIVGTVVASDADGDTLNYSIVSGNESGAFEIDATSGELKVADTTILDYETIKDFSLTIRVSDGKSTVDTNVAIHVTNVNDNQPVVEDATFSVNEKATNGTVIGTIDSTDADGDTVSYMITTGNSDGIFTINETTGEIKLVQSSLLNAVEKATHILSIEASDGLNTSTLTVTINVQSSDATLRQLSSNHGELNPAFQPGITHYTMNVSNAIDELNLTAIANQANAVVKINGILVEAGDESEAIKLASGKNTITIEVQAQNGDTKTYKIDVTRLKLIVVPSLESKGGTVNVSDEDVNLLDQDGTIVIELKDQLDKIKNIQFTSNQLKTLISKNAMIHVVKADVELKIPARNFVDNGEKLTIQLVRIDKNAKKLPSSDLAISAVYDVTIKLGDKIISQFDHEIEIAFPTEYAQPEELKIYYFNEDTNKWEIVGGAYENGYIKANTNHFSTYAVFHPKDLVEKDTDTDSGGELPSTATSIYNWMVSGIAIITLGLGLLFIQRRRKASSNM